MGLKSGGWCYDPLSIGWPTPASASKPFTAPKETHIKHIYHPEREYAIIWDEGAYGYLNNDIDAVVAKGIEPSIIYEHAWQWDTEVREANIRGAAMRDLQTRTLKALKAAGLPVDVDEGAIAKAAALLPDVGAIVAGIVKALPAGGGVTAAQIAAELSKRLAA